MISHTLKCANCGANDLVAQGQSLMKCSYCNSVILVEGNPSQSIGVLKENLVLHTRKIETIFKRLATYVHDGIRDGGHLHVTRSEIVFVPHALNIISGYRLVFPYSELRDIRKVTLYLVVRQLVITSASGDEDVFIVWGRDKFIEAVRRQL